MKLIKDIQEKEKLKQNFLIKEVSTGVTTKGSPYYNVILQDSSGTVEGKKWDIKEGDELIFKAGRVVEVEADVLLYKGKYQLKITDGSYVDDKDIEVSDFVAGAPVERIQLQSELNDFIKLIENEEIKLIVEEMLKNNFLSFSIYPAASKNHHEYSSGLIHHTVSMLKVARSICDLYSTLDRDLLYSGVILHDMGKTQELSGPIAPQYTTEGKLIGHISICQAQIRIAADKLSIMSEIPTLLQHMVLSHHGKLEFGSPVLPLLKEAEILSFIDNIDARINSIDKALESVNEGEFTQRIFALENRMFYKPFKK